MDERSVDLKWPQLSPDHLGLVLAILAARLPARSVHVYGSRARGTARPASDLDLLIEGAEPVDELTLAHLEQDFVDSDLPFRVQIADGARMDLAFRRRIEADLVRL